MKKIMLIGSIMIICIVIIVTFLYSPMNVDQVNTNIKISDLQLLMTKIEVENTMKDKAVYVNGFGGYGLKFMDRQLFVSFNSDGRYKDKVTYLQTDNGKDDVLGIHVGDTRINALSQLEKKHFRKNRESHYINGKFYIDIFENDDTLRTIKMIRIGIEDPDRKNRIY
jgi:uncharacterized protein YxeA